MRRLGFVLVVGVVLCTVAPAWAASPVRETLQARRDTPTTAATATVATSTGVDADALEPTLSCTSRDDPAKGLDTTVFGYVNHSKARVTLPVGTWNSVSDAPGVNPPTVFEPGKHPHAFEAHVGHGVVAHWALGTHEVAGGGPRCKGRISPVLAKTIMRSVAWGASPLMLLWVVFAIKRKRTRDAARSAS